MSTIFGVFDKNGHDIPVHWNKLMLEACDLWPRDRESNINKGACILSCLQQFNTPQSSLAEQPYTQSDSSNYIIFDGRLDNRSELAELVGLALTDAITDELLLLKAFQKYDTDIGQHLLGDFSIVFYNTQKHELYIIRDQLGVKPLFIASNKSYIAFASNKSALLSLPWVNRQTNEQWLADLLTITKVDHLSTFYQGIESFPPANWLKYDITTKCQQYWTLDLNHQLPELSESEYVEQFKSLLFESVHCRLRTYGEPATELSGGLDSTSIASVAAKLLNNNFIHAYSHVMCKQIKDKVFPYSDEIEYMEELAGRFSNIKHYAITSKGLGVLDKLKYSVEVHSGPSRNDLSQLGDDLFLHVRKNDQRTLLSGFGGDQLVTSSGSGWEEELMTSGRWWKLVKSRFASGDRLSNIIKRLAFNFATRRLGLKNRKLKKIGNNWAGYLKRIVLNQHFAEKNGYPARYYDHPTRKKHGNIKQREYEVINSPHILYRLEDSAVGAASYGIDYRYPLLDIRLLQFCLALPSDLKVSKGVRRNMIRQAMDGILPDKIRLRHNKSLATIPTTFQRILNEKNRLHEYLLSFKDDDLAQSYINGKQILDYLAKISARPDTSKLLKQKSLFRCISLLLWLKQEK